MVLQGMYRELFYNPMYWLAVLSCLLIYERKAPYRAVYLMVLSLFQGLFTGILTTAMVVYLGVYIHEEHIFMYLMPVSLFLSWFRKRWICYAYSSAVVAIPCCIAGVLDNRTVSGMICVVGILHIAEAVLCAFSKGQERIWPLSWGMLIESAGLTEVNMPGWWPLLGEASVLSVLPVTALLAYHGREGERKRECIQIVGYGLMLLGLGILSIRFTWLLIPVLLLQIICHEIITKKP